MNSIALQCLKRDNRLVKFVGTEPKLGDLQTAARKIWSSDKQKKSCLPPPGAKSGGISSHLL